MAKLNLEFYSGEDGYSDGDIENEILKMVTNEQEYTEIACNRDEWAVWYHLSPIRRNLLEWYEFSKNETLLEIGGGCGAFSGMFCDKLKSVKVVELSKRRSEIIFQRHKNHSNLEIVVGNLNDITFSEKFDYITLIGVLEYAGKFTCGATPYQTFLEKLKEYLKPQGRLIIAIENKFGLKYWAGSKEEHTGRYFDGLEGYPLNKEIQTFGKSELAELLYSAGYKQIEWYYPTPDYKLPKVIYSDHFLPTIADYFDVNTPNFDQERVELFKEDLVFKNIIKNNAFDFFSNSFLLIVK